VEIEGKRILITGGANGIGLALVEAWSGVEASEIAIIDNDDSALSALSEKFPDTYCECVDITDPEEVRSTIKRLIDALDSIEILVNNAGIVHNEPLITLGADGIKSHSSENWARVIETNLCGTFYVTTAVVRHMLARRTRGVIVNISSICSIGNAGQSAYSAAKAGINALTVAWARELGPTNIRVVSVAPGFISTETTLRSVEAREAKKLAKRTPSRRFGEPHEVVDTIMFAVQNDFINGTILEIDGGLTL